MTIRNRSLAVGGLAALALLGAAVQADAHSVALDASCSIVGTAPAVTPTFVFSSFPLERDSTVTISGSIDGVFAGELPVVIHPTAAAPVVTMHAPPVAIDYGEHLVVVDASWQLPEHQGGGDRALTVDCGPAPAPAPEPPTITPAVAAPPVLTTPPLPAAPAPRRYACPARLLPSRSWQRIIWRRHRVMCPLRRPTPPTHVAVAGEWKGGGR